MSRKKDKAVTITNVAEEAGVSVATVSRVLNNPQYKVSDEVRQKVLTAAERLKYCKGGSRKVARLREQIGVIVPNITSCIYAQALTGIEAVAKDNNYGVFICNSLRDPEREYNYLCEMARKRIRSVILSSVITESKIIKEFTDRGLNIVLLDQNMPELDCAHVNFDMHTGVGIAVNHLIELGHTRIGLVIMPATRWSSKRIISGYQEVLTAAGIPKLDSLIFTSDNEHETCASGGDFRFGTEIGHQIAARISEMSALVISSSLISCGVLNAFKEHGIKVPQQISLVSLDDFAPASIINPAITSLRLPVFDVGKIAAGIIVSNLTREAPNDLIDLNIKSELIIRESTQAYKSLP